MSSTLEKQTHVEAPGKKLKPTLRFTNTKQALLWSTVATRNTNVLHINRVWSLFLALSCLQEAWGSDTHWGTASKSAERKHHRLCSSLGVSYSNVSSVGVPVFHLLPIKRAVANHLCARAATTEFWLSRIDCTWQFSKSPQKSPSWPSYGRFLVWVSCGQNQRAGQQWKRGNGWCQLCDNT